MTVVVLALLPDLTPSLTPIQTVEGAATTTSYRIPPSTRQLRLGPTPSDQLRNGKGGQQSLGWR
jgi:hypothetical protein